MDAQTDANAMTKVARRGFSDHSSAVPPSERMIKFTRPYSWLNIQLMVIPDDQRTHQNGDIDHRTGQALGGNALEQSSTATSSGMMTRNGSVQTVYSSVRPRDR